MWCLVAVLAQLSALTAELLQSGAQVYETAHKMGHANLRRIKELAGQIHQRPAQPA